MERANGDATKRKKEKSQLKAVFKHLTHNLLLTGKWITEQLEIMVWHYYTTIEIWVWKEYLTYAAQFCLKKEEGQSSYELQVKNFRSLYKAIKLHQTITAFQFLQTA